MFGYNILSDLKNGQLVTPIRMENGIIVCLTQNGEEVECSFEDFDFERTEEERLIEIDNSDNETVIEETKEEVIDNKIEEENKVEKLEEFITEEEKIKILELFNFKYNKHKLNKVNILKSKVT